MLVSIITVVKNDLRRLKKTVLSLKKIYGHSEFEHIIIDGKSNDNIYNFVNKLKLINANILFKSSNDLGIYDAMNRGVDLCKGKFILFLNAGDELLISRIELVNKLKEYYNVDIDILCFPFQHEFAGNIIYRKPMKKTRDKLPTSHQAMFFSKKFIKQHKYNLLYKISSDFDLYQAASFAKIHIITSCNDLTRVESEGVASKNFNLSYMEHVQIISIHYNGFLRFYLINNIVLKFCVIKILKCVFSKSIILKIRKVFYHL